jgi:hypothetical protein
MLHPMQPAPRMGYKRNDSLVTKVGVHTGNFLLNCVDFGVYRAFGEVKNQILDYYEDSRLYDLDLFKTSTKSLEIEINSYR